MLELGGAVDAMSGPASDSVSIFCNGSSFVNPSIGISRDPDAESVSTGATTHDAWGLISGDDLPENSCVC